MDLFPFKLSGTKTIVGGVTVAVVAIVVNAAIWFAFAFIVAYAAAKGVAAA